MSIDELTDPSAVHKAAEESQELGRAAFREKYNFGPVQRYFVVVDGRLHEAKAIVGAAFGFQHPDRGPLQHGQFSGGETAANPALARLGFNVVSRRPTTSDDEVKWRKAVANHFDRLKNADGYVTPDVLREWGAYGGAQGVWCDAQRTREIDPAGIAVGVLHTGFHYADDLNEEGILYHYPTTNRPAARDSSEITAMKRAADLKVPVFVVSKPTPSSRWREVRLAWIEGWDDVERIFSLTFSTSAPSKVQDHDDSDEHPFEMFGNSSRRGTTTRKQRPGQRLFKLKVIQRYGARCPLSGVTVLEMLEAAHLVPDGNNGSEDPRNGLPLNAALHRAFDAGLFAINPTTLAVEVRPGLAPEDLGIKIGTIVDLPKKPHTDALSWRYEWWTAQAKNAS
ncbi:hypothetical protein Aca07nite_19530 [Actinoplanes capillaceus]|uniref:HNH endonuclease n=1 Tax=Actinoplanes campanulatus TaxID=113559 RepID=A0ABQ3WEL8_9ACTN|nr:HNH endonuclease [Actinoplanes capillaceus]GID44678.1 hypothetical protein Aca07nite_19530 [Actinoplanes capillaceus]